MIQVNVREKDIERLSLDQIPCPKDSRSSIKNDTQFGHHHAGCVPAIVGVVAGSA